MTKADVVDFPVARKEIFLGLSRALWERPELSFEEENSGRLQREAAETLGFRVRRLDSIQAHAFVAEFGDGEPVLGLLGEYDALPGLSQKVAGVRDPAVPGGPGHACGHNLLGTACLAAATAIKEAIAAGALRGTVRYFGCPAEEQLGKPVLARAGVFDGLDAVLCWHPADINTVAAYGTNASLSLEFRFTGKSAHAAQVPHLGRSALDALTLMNVGTEFLREHMPPAARVHYIVASGGERPNIVPGLAAGIFQVRSPRMAEAVDLAARVVDVARGAALMTGTAMEYRFQHGCYDVMPNLVVSEALRRNLASIPLPAFDAADRELARALGSTFTEDQKRVTMTMLGLDQASAAELARLELHEAVGDWGRGWTIPASTDVGDVSHIAPTAQINTATWPLGVGSHTWQATAASGSGIGAKGMIYAARVMAGAGWDLLSDPAALREAKREFEAATCGARYVCAEDLIAGLRATGSGA